MPSSVPERIERQLARRRWLRRGVWVVLAVLAVTAALSRTGLMLPSDGDSRSTVRSGATNDWATFDQRSFLVTRVIDGDTLYVRPAASGGRGAETKVRVIGVDAPELNSDTGRPDHWAVRAKDYVDARARGRIVTLKLEPTETRDRHGRLLAYIYLSDSENLSLALVRDGQAYADRRHDHTYCRQLEQAENAARTKGFGWWESVREDQMPRWRQGWLERRRDRTGTR